MSVLPGIAQSTYRESYRGLLSTLPLIKYKNLPCMYPAGSSEPCKQILSDTKSIALKRVTEPVPCPLSVSPPVNHRPKSSKPHIVNETPAETKLFETKFGTMDMAMINELSGNMRYSTFTQRAGAEFALPVYKIDPPNTTWVPKPDMVRLRGRKYDDIPEDWQNAVLWDRIQARPPTQPPTSPCPEKMRHRRHILDTLEQAKQNQILEHVKKDALANVFVKKCPGYAGYAPLCPPETKLDDKKRPANITSEMSASYSKFPDHVLAKSRYARKGVYSKTIELTYPFNPFNKIGVQINAVDKESKYTGMPNHLEFSQS